MLDEKNKTHQSHPSLLPLRAALALAESEVPSRPHRVDSNERLAMQLIARVQARYQKADLFLRSGEGLRRLAGDHAR
jgi:hypothetical protein